jgi:hypothetical protein
MLKREGFWKACAALALVFCAVLATSEAQARPGGWWVRGRVSPGAAAAAVVAAAVIGAVIEAPPPVVAVHTTYAPVAVYGPPVYGPPVYGPPPPPVVFQAPAPVSTPTLGIGVAGLLASPAAGPLSAGTAVSLQHRPSSHTLMALELQSLRSARAADGSRREELAGMLAARFFPWDAVLAPYLDLAAGFGRMSSIECCMATLHTDQFLARYGLGLELRLGQHLVFEGQLAQVHRFSIDGDAHRADPIGNPQRATELRGGVAFRF